jgi:hypothetical protein
MTRPLVGGIALALAALAVGVVIGRIAPPPPPEDPGALPPRSARPETAPGTWPSERADVPVPRPEPLPATASGWVGAMEPDAEKAEAHAVRYDPRDPKRRVELGLLERDLGHYRAADRQLRIAIRLTRGGHMPETRQGMLRALVDVVRLAEPRS